MTGIHDLALFIAAGLLLNVTPGPDTLYIVARSTGQGLRAGALAALGIGAGCCVHILAAAIGVSALLLASATAFTIVKILGAAYLVYVGVALLRSGSAGEVPAPSVRADGLSRIFVQGLLTNALNPKVAVFFVAFLPQFVRDDAPDKFAALLLLGIVFNVNATLWNLFVAWLASNAARVLARDDVRRWTGRIAGGLMVALGIRLAFSARP